MFGESYFQDDVKKIFLPSCFSADTSTPLWEVDLYDLKSGEDEIKIHPDGFVFNLNPLLIRNYVGGAIVMRDTQFSGVLAVDTN